jgi:spore photoproduct lyase
LSISSFNWKPERVFVSEESAGDEVTKRVLSALSGVEVVHLSKRGDPLTELGLGPRGASEAELLSLGKKQLYLTRYHGEWMKPCPGTLDHVCCNLWVVNPYEGCPIDCTYCALQSYLRRNPTIKIFTNTGDMVRAIEARVSSEPERLFRVCTGELSDSLALDGLTALSLELIPFFAGLPNAVLELKTKTNLVSNVLSFSDRHGGRTVVSWSLNAPSVAEQEELLASSLEERLEAAAEVAKAGYRVGFHFDPLVLHESWEEGYRGTVSRIFSLIPPDSIAWVSIAALRYHPLQQQLMLERFPGSRLPLGEHFLGSDNKLRIPQPIRFKMLKFLWQELKKGRERLPVYMCMESPAAWRAVIGALPARVEDAAEVYARGLGGVDNTTCPCTSAKACDKR